MVELICLDDLLDDRHSNFCLKYFASITYANSLIEIIYEYKWEYILLQYFPHIYAFQECQIFAWFLFQQSFKSGKVLALALAWVPFSRC